MATTDTYKISSVVYRLVLIICFFSLLYNNLLLLKASGQHAFSIKAYAGLSYLLLTIFLCTAFFRTGRRSTLTGKILWPIVIILVNISIYIELFALIVLAFLLWLNPFDLMLLFEWVLALIALIANLLVLRGILNKKYYKNSTISPEAIMPADHI
ncbi:MAG: hypothetical protein JST39_22440 [Bacteroidetes bacterium]|nr:hypothetical protein [Bacteroidota bacterium]